MENSLLGLDSKVNAVVSAKDIADIEHRDVFCFGHLLFEMCTGLELQTSHPTTDNLFLDLERYPKVKKTATSNKNMVQINEICMKFNFRWLK